MICLILLSFFRCSFVSENYDDNDDDDDHHHHKR